MEDHLEYFIEDLIECPYGKGFLGAIQESKRIILRIPQTSSNFVQVTLGNTL